jgi:hypothetical protein
MTRHTRCYVPAGRRFGPAAGGLGFSGGRQGGRSASGRSETAATSRGRSSVSAGFLPLAIRAPARAVAVGLALRVERRRRAIRGGVGWLADKAGESTDHQEAEEPAQG